MGDRSDAHLIIGGDIPEGLLPELIKVMTEDGLGSEYQSDYVDLTEQVFKDAHDRETHSGEFYAHEMAGGHLECTVPFLTEHGIDFIHWQDGCYAYDSSIVYHIGGETWTWSTVNGRPVMTVQELQNLFDTAVRNGEDVCQFIVNALTSPELKPVRIVPGPVEDETSREQDSAEL